MSLTVIFPVPSMLNAGWLSPSTSVFPPVIVQPLSVAVASASPACTSSTLVPADVFSAIGWL